MLVKEGIILMFEERVEFRLFERSLEENILNRMYVGRR